MPATGLSSSRAPIWTSGWGACCGRRRLGACPGAAPCAGRSAERGQEGFDRALVAQVDHGDIRGNGLARRLEARAALAVEVPVVGEEGQEILVEQAFLAYNW